MEYFREELLPNVFLTALRTDKFKTGCLSAALLTQLDRETAAQNAAIPYVLRRGTVELPDMSAYSARLEELYGAELEPLVRKRGEIQCIGFRADFCEDRFLPGRPALAEDMARLLGETWLAPVTRGGLFLPAYVESERDKLLERIDAALNDKRGYALRRLMECMCPCEAYAVDRLGGRAEAESLHYVRLTKAYKALLAASPLELFYCGAAEPARVADTLRAALQSLPRGETDPELGTDIRMNAVEAEPRTFTEELDVTQGKLAVGFRLGECMEDPDPAAIRVFNAVYGGCVTSRLFTHVRERLSLCYYASSLIDLHKGILAVSSGIEFDKYDAALAEIQAQLAAVARGEVTPEELDAAKKYVASQLRAVTDSPAGLEDFYLDQTVLGLDYGPLELAALCESVTAEQVAGIARSAVCDAVYFLRGQEAAP